MILKLLRHHQNTSLLSRTGSLRAFSTDTQVPTMEEIGRNINDHQYSGNYKPTFNYAGVAELVYDAHAIALKPRGTRFMSSLLGLSIYGNYYYYAMIPFSQTHFIMTLCSTFILGIMQMNSSMSKQLSVIEILVLPSRDLVRFVTMSGAIIETPIKEVSLISYKNDKITLLTKPLNNKTFRIVIDLNHKFIKSEYTNAELIMAIAHPDCHKI